jgi:tetratricopeptide (TPR) repeat protein
LRGDFAEIERVDALVDDLLGRVGTWPDLCALKAMIDVKLHRGAEVRGRLDLVPGLAETPDGRRVLADVAIQERRWEDARALLAEARSWQELARLAEVERLLGAYDEADRRYAEAEDDLTAKQMRSYAWVEVQRGVLDVARRRYAEARAHYDVAEQAYSGYWFVAEHVAALHAAEGRLEEAAELYETLPPRPELFEALSHVYERLGRLDDARSSRDRARGAYLASVERGFVHYLHHLDHLGDG